MRVTITGPFATAKDTARILGVSDKRLKELLRLRSSGRLSGPKKNGWALDLEKNGSKAKLEWHIKSGCRSKTAIHFHSRKIVDRIFALPNQVQNLV